MNAAPTYTIESVHGIKQTIQLPILILPSKKTPDSDSRNDDSGSKS